MGVFYLALYNILVVDDEVSSLNALERALRREYTVFSATSGEDALAIMEERHIDLIIADYRMPGMTGVELVEKALEKYPNTIRVILTAYTNENLLMDAINMIRVHGYLAKPWEPEEIKALIRKCEASEAERKKIEERLIRSEKLASIGKLSANLAHELNNSVNATLRYIQLLLDELSEDDSRRMHAERARDGLMQMANMARGLLDFAEKSTPVFSPTDISQSIRRILSSFSDQISAQNIKVEAEFDENIPVIMNADVEQIFVNVIKNAIQAMPDGGTLSVKARMVSAELFEARFSDTGPGIPDEIRENIFDPFFTTKNFGQGVGLGLSISHRLVESYDGSIDLQSELGKGTTFVIRLPISETGLTVSQIGV
jgi:signal transduction histidine kinase